MLNEKVEKALNEQIKKELYSEYLYMSMSAYCESIDLPGMAKFLMAQAAEEREHAMRLYNFVFDRGGRVILQALPQPETDFSGFKEVFEKVLEHEKYVTKSIHELYEVALKENDYATQVELQWFIEEQVEEEKQSSDIVQQINMIGDNKTAIFMLDNKLGTREED
jgi:ferritin